MSMVCGLDLHRQQITFDALETGSGEVWRGRVWQPDRDRFRRWLCHDVARRAEGQPVAMAVEGCTGWRYVAEEIVAAGFEVHVAEPADTQTARGKKHRAKTDRSDARLLRELLQRGELPDSRDEQTAEPPRSSSVATAGADAVTAAGTTSLASVSTTPPQFETRPSPSTTVATMQAATPTAPAATYSYAPADLDQALAAVGVAPSTPAMRRNIEDGCRSFSARDVTGMNRLSTKPGLQRWTSTGSFGRCSPRWRRRARCRRER